MMDLVAFAAERSGRLNDFDDEIEPIVERALDDYGSGASWYADIVEGASVLWLEIFEKTSPKEDSTAPLEAFQRELGLSLAKTSKPSDPPTMAQVERISRWVGVYSVNSAQYHAARAGGSLEKTWIDMEDDHVRPTHRAAAGQTVPIKGTFDVGGYKLHFPGEPEGPPEIWINCRCLLATTGGTEMAGKTSFAVNDPYPNEEEGDGIHVDDELTDDQIESEDLVDDDTETPWHGVLVVEGSPTGDRRQFEPGSLSNRNLPLPLSFQRMSADGHMQSVVVGRIDRIEREGAEMRGYGAFNLNVPEANEVIDGLVFGSLGGVSVDVDNSEYVVDMKEVDEDDEDLMGMLFGGEVELTRFTAGRICGATLVSIPAFQEAFIALGPDFEDVRDPEAGVGDAGTEEGEADTEYSYLNEWQNAAFAAIAEASDKEELDAAYSLVASAFAPGTHDGPGWIKNPRATQRLRSYWVHGKGALKIRWGVPGDFNRCRRQLSKYVNPAFLAGTCANLHKEALKVWPGRERGDKHAVEGSFNIVASGSSSPDWLSDFPAPWFADPGLEHLTALTVEDDGRIYGHLAGFGTCHTSVQNTCVVPPRSAINYGYYRTGLVDTDEGPVPVGQITMGTGHAKGGLSAGAATKHYDNTGTVVADVAVGEDKFGIWFAGALRDDLTPAEVKRFKAAALSGDWRMVNGNLELVATLAVNVPGFPVPRMTVGMAGDSQVSLVASGILPTESKSLVASGQFITVEELDERLAAVGRIVVDEMEYRTERKDRLARVRDEELVELATSRRSERIAAARTLEE